MASMKEKMSLEDKEESPPPCKLLDILEFSIIIALVLGGFAFILQKTSPAFFHSHATNGYCETKFDWMKVHGSAFDQFTQEDFEDDVHDESRVQDQRKYRVKSLASLLRKTVYEKIIPTDNNMSVDSYVNKKLQIEYVQLMQTKHGDNFSKNKNFINEIVEPVKVDKIQKENSAKQCNMIPENERFDCHPEELATEVVCLARGCCWHKNLVENTHEAKFGVPYCFYPKNYEGYTVSGVSEHNDREYLVDLKRTRRSYYPDEIQQLQMVVIFETNYRLRVKIFDPNNQRWEVPISQPKVTERSRKDEYMYSVAMPVPNNSFSLIVSRTSTNITLINTTGAFIFNDQFLQLSYFLPSNFIYGLGEHRDTLLHSVNWTKFVMWNKDQPPVEDSNLYGSHPFYLMVENDGHSHGVLLLNSNAMEVILQPAPAITWRTIGGILDFYVFLGPTPSDVISQYTEVIGRTFMPPYWSLGFHQCRWGYTTAKATQDIADKLTEVGMPQDVQWNDIDYMDSKRDFTTSPTFGNQKDLVNYLHSQGKHYMMIVDPGISDTKKGQYPPYDLGMSLGIFINDSDGKTLVGKVWPGTTVFPDFTNPLATTYWTKLVKTFHDEVAFDGMWIDMNEISNFVEGSMSGCPQKNRYEHPPYLPGVKGGSLKFTTICASGRQHLSRTYDVHNLYGLGETNASYSALLTARPGKRPFVISRSTFPGQGQYGGHWTGDNAATFYDMYKSISDILSMNMFGIPMVGADICGFRNPTNEQLCQRWYQLGAFYPFSRSHNDHKMPDQDPTAFSSALLNSTRDVYLTRYSLLPYLYTLFYKSHVTGDTVARPIFFEFTKDKLTYSVDRQFLWGSALMVSPVLDQDTTQVTVYFPNTTWFDLSNGSRVTDIAGTKILPSPMSHINLHIRGGYILPMQEPALTTTHSRKNKFWLLVAMLRNLEATGELYWDDGDSVDSYSTGAYNLLQFNAKNNTVTSDLKHMGYTAEPMTLGNVTVLGVLSEPKTVTVNQNTTSFKYNQQTQVLYITDIKVDLLKYFSLAWS